MFLTGQMAKTKKLIVANWKMNPQSSIEAKSLFNGIKKKASKLRNVQTVVCPPFIYINELSKSYSGNKVLLGGQDIFYKEGGSFTGEVSPKQLKDTGSKYVIIGHSERRAMGEKDVDVNLKVNAALKEKLNVIICIGESERDSHGKYLHFLRNQIEHALKRVNLKSLKNVIIAYEPIWAIGKTGDDAINPQKLHETSLFIRRVLSEIYNKKVSQNVKIIYGGSVEPENTKALLSDTGVVGFLVGHASLNAKQFGEILKISNDI